MPVDTNSSNEANALPGELLRRHSSNPILRAEDWPYPVNAVFNAAAVRLAGGETLLLCRVEDHMSVSHLCAARSVDGIGGWQIDPLPTMAPQPEAFPEEYGGIEDPRITWLAELGRYVVVYTSFARQGPLVSIALTEDFRTFERVGPVLPPENKDAALLPRKIGGRWPMSHRPVSHNFGNHIWICFSHDLRHWGDHAVVMEARSAHFWDARKIGLSPPPIETPQGWLVLYHGVRETVSGQIYRTGLALLDLDDPRRCIRRGKAWVFGPRSADERVGDVANVAFACGTTLADDGDTLRFYYGAADTSVCLATGSVREMLAWLEEHGRIS